MSLFPASGSRLERDRVGKGWTGDGVIPAHGDVECYVEVGLVTARVELYVPLRRHSQDVPLNWKKMVETFFLFFLYTIQHFL
jgi:hypothetical protein